MTYLTVPSFAEYQHYKKRNPPWIKLHRRILENYDFCKLDDSCKWHLVAIWILASQLNNKIPNDPEWIKEKIGGKDSVDVNLLIKLGFLKLLS